MTELQSLVAESRQAQMAFGAIGLAHFLYLLFCEMLISLPTLINLSPNYQVIMF